jgi:hypothetical protein
MCPETGNIVIIKAGKEGKGCSILGNSTSFISSRLYPRVFLFWDAMDSSFDAQIVKIINEIM